MFQKGFSVVSSVVLLFCALALAFDIQSAKAVETVYIRADGSIDPPTAPIATLDNVTYALTGDITSSATGIVVERDDIVIDGDGYALRGNGAVYYAGIYLSERTNVTVHSTQIQSFMNGIWLEFSSNSCVSGNNIVDMDYGNGIYVGSSFNNRISGNYIANIYHLGRGICIGSSSNNSVSENNVGTGEGDGILIASSFNNNISRNNIKASYLGSGISIVSSSDNSVNGNNIASNYRGVKVDSSSNNSICGNSIERSHYGGGIEFWSSSNNRAIGNNITNNNIGIGGGSYSDNVIYHNNFVDNTPQAYSDSTNIWDDGYLSGGNFWNDYEGADANGDGIGDVPYVINADNRDKYPLMHPWPSLHSVGGVPVHVDKLDLVVPWIHLALITLITTTGTAVHARRRKRKQ